MPFLARSSIRRWSIGTMAGLTRAGGDRRCHLRNPERNDKRGLKGAFEGFWE